jgi:hypothetical protein
LSNDSDAWQFFIGGDPSRIAQTLRQLLAPADSQKMENEVPIPFYSFWLRALQA